MALGKDAIFVLAVALLTWGGVFFYMLRLDRLAKSLQDEVRALEAETKKAELSPSGPPLADPH